MLEDIWKSQQLAVPKRFKGQVPLYQVIGEYRMELCGENLSVARAFAQCQEMTKVGYEGHALAESVTIKDGIIVEVHSNVTVRLETMPDLRTKKGQAALQRLFTPPKTSVPIYRNIKRYEEYLRMLPWQDDLEAIYNGSGIFRKRQQ